MATPKLIDVESAAVIAHMQIMQAVITRMASNSSACKTWCITLISAILVLIADKEKPDMAMIAAIPTLLFCFLDTYYLALERHFRAGYNKLLKKISNQSLTTADLYQVKPAGPFYKHFFSSLCSAAIFVFYICLGILIWLAKELVLKGKAAG